MNMERLLKSVREHEGYRNKVYLDTLGKRTVGVGTSASKAFGRTIRNMKRNSS